jgi:hypothetical protein
MALSDLVEYLGAAKAALDLLKGVQSELPKGEKSDKAQAQITKAEESLTTDLKSISKEVLGHEAVEAASPVAFAP